MPLVFVDLEASSLSPHSYPIELGWVFEDGKGDSHLIRPMPQWRDWDDRSQAMHGITPGQLKREGKPASIVARQAMEAMNGCEIVSDQPEWDAMWLNRLLDSVGMPAVKLLLLDNVVRDACRPLLRLLAPLDSPERAASAVRVRDLAMEVQNGAFASEERRQRIRHRALHDAESNWRIWDHARRTAEEILIRESGKTP